jgi:hypothetical protein
MTESTSKPIGKTQAEMGAAAKEQPGSPPAEEVVTFPEVAPAVSVVTPDTGQGQVELGKAVIWANNTTKRKNSKQ